MRPNVEYSRDPLRREQLPDSRSLELDYRVEPTSFRESEAFFQTHLAEYVFRGFGAAMLVNLTGCFTSWFPWLGFVPLMILLWFLAHADYQAVFLRAPGTNLTLLLCLWLLSTGRDAWLMGAAYLGVVLAALVLAWSVTRHHARYCSTHLGLTRATRVRWAQQWTNTLGLVASEEQAQTPGNLPDLEANEQRERKELQRRVGLTLGAAMVGVAVYWVASGPFGGFAAAGATVALWLEVSRRALAGHPARPSTQDALQCYWAAAVGWYSYNSRETHAPGVFQSPVGPFAARDRLLGTTLFGAALVVPPFVSYCPVGVFLFGSSPWLDAAENWSSLWRTGQSNGPQAAVWAFAQPEHYLLLTFYGMAEGRLSVALSFVLNVAGSLVAGVSFVALAGFSAFGRTIWHLHETLEVGTYHERGDMTRWAQISSRLKESRNSGSTEAPAESDLLYLGAHRELDYPILTSPETLEGHAWITGDTGSSKTSIGMSQIIAQLAGRPDASIVILDCKGDHALFHSTRQWVAAANRRGRAAARQHVDFRYFTNVPGDATFAFNPFVQRHVSTRLTVNQRAELLLQSLGLEYGAGYGREHFALGYREVTTRILEVFQRVESFAEFTEILRSDKALAKELEIAGETMRDARDLRAMTRMLATLPALNLTQETAPNPACWRKRIDLADTVNRPQVIYFWLSSSLETAMVRQIGKIVMFSLLTAAETVGRQGHRTYLVIDEFQRLVSENIDITLQQARSKGISAILANQTLSDMQQNQIDMLPTVQANTRVKQVFAASDLRQQREIIEASGEEQHLRFQWRGVDPDALLGHEVTPEHRTSLHGSRGPMHTSGSSQGVLALHDPFLSLPVDVSEEAKPRIGRNDILEISAEKRASLLKITQPSGYAQYGGFDVPLRSDYPLSLAEYQRCMRLAWPRAGRGAFVPSQVQVRTHAGPPTVDPSSAEASTAEVAAELGVLLEAVQSESQLSDIEQRIEQSMTPKGGRRVQ